MGADAGSSAAAPRARLQRRNSGDQVAARIRRAIIDGEFRTGERLRQDDIAASLGVSRIPVREAMVALDREGWVRIEPNRGAYVAGLSADDVRDHYELRGLVFGLVARRATAAAGVDDLRVLNRDVRALRSAGTAAEFAEINDGVLRKLVSLAASARLSAALRVMASIIPEGFFEVVPGAREAQTAGLGAVLRAMKAADADKADTAMQALLRSHGEAVVDVFAAHGVLGDG